MAYMINSLRNNNKLLRRKGMFDKDTTFLNNVDGTYGPIKDIRASPELLEEIRQKTKKEQKKETKKRIILFLTLLIPSIYFLIFTLNAITAETKTDNLTIERQSLTQQYNKVLQYTIQGDDWFSKGKWHNAAFMYQKAVKIYPNSYDYNYRLARAYGQACYHESRYCNVGSELTNKLITLFPEKKELSQLELLFLK